MKTHIKTVALLGPDGAGKTTLLNHLELELIRQEVDFKRYYFAPGFLKRYRPSGPPIANTNPHVGQQYGATLVFLKVALMLFEFRMGLPKVKRCKHISLFDRFIHDLLVDPKRYRLGSVRWWMRLMLKLAPCPDLVIIITAEPDVIQARKQEVTPEETARQVAAYQQVATLFPRAINIDNSGVPEITARHIANEILVG